MSRSELFQTESPVQYQIIEPALEPLLPAGARILRVPTNAEKQVPDSTPIYKTVPFPRWSLCTEHNTLYIYSQGASRTGCPRCPPLKDRWAARARSRREAIRFVLACPEGHLSDVNWTGLMKHEHPSCSPSHLLWIGGGGALRNVYIQCPDCGGKANLGTAYGREWPCPGYFPEQESSDPECTTPAKILQRGAANLHVAEVCSAVTVPRLDTPLHQALSSPVVKALLVVIPLEDGASLREMLAKLAAQKVLPPWILPEVSKYSDADLLQAAQDVQANPAAQDPQQARLNEFRELQRAATRGHPLQMPAGTAAPLFEVPVHQVRTVSAPRGIVLRVAPVSRLRVVMVQTGYRRLGGKVVECGFRHGAELWFPGVELYGEGVFIDLLPQPGAEGAVRHPDLPGDKAWRERWMTDREPANHPVFVWWHSLAHRLIRALSFDSGYSSTAVRERVYVRIDDSGQATGGVLLYAAQTGGDGTLGGLIALVPSFERVLRAALRNLDSCSNDPLCDETVLRPGRGNGAACYACEFVSETSCEHRNLNLDRHLLMASFCGP